MTAGFTDEFTSLDPARWAIGDHVLGRGRLDPANSERRCDPR
jgi:hypothetical protein